MPRPPKSVRVSISTLFPLLMYYYAASKDRVSQGEYSTDWTWDTFCADLDKQNGLIDITPKQLAHLVYNYKVATYDRRIPVKAVKQLARQYLPNMRKIMKELPNLFKEDKDNEVIMIDLDWKE